MHAAQERESARTPEQQTTQGIMSHERRESSPDLIKTLLEAPLYRQRFMDLHETLLKVKRGEI